MEEKIHSLTLENRQKLSLTDCSEVISFNEKEVALRCDGAKLLVKGEGLRVEEVSVKNGEVIINGNSIDSITYTKKAEKNDEGVIRRIFK